MNPFSLRMLLFCFLSLCCGGVLRVANAQTPERLKSIDMKHALDQIIRDYKVNFIYESKLIEGYQVSIGALDEKKLDALLSAVFQPHSIGYYQIDKNNYALFQLLDSKRKDIPANNSGKSNPVEQEEFSISGSVLDQSGKALAYTTVYLQRVDSVLVAAAIADTLGRFGFGLVPKGIYRIKATRLGYRPVYSPNIQLTSGNVRMLNSLVLAEAPKNLGQVQIDMPRPLVEYQRDRTIVNVDGSFSGAGFSVYDILEASPGLTLANGFNGKQDFSVTIDGNAVKLPNQQLIYLLRGMSLGSVSQIELIHSPSAKYEAKGRGDLINIKMKNNQLTGLNGTLASLFSMGSQPKFTQTVAVQYNFRKVNLFATYNFQHHNNERQLFGSSKINDVAPIYFLRQEEGISRSAVHDAEVWGTYQLNSKNNISFKASLDVNNNSSDFARHLALENSKTGTMVDSVIRSFDEGLRELRRYGFNINPIHSFKKDGHSLSFFIDYNRYSSDDQNSYHNSYYGAVSSAAAPLEKLSSAERIALNLFSLGLDYTCPIAIGHEFEAGFKIDFNYSKSRLLFSYGQPDAEMLDLNRTNTFQYRERISAGYINYKGKIGKQTNLQIGVRAENTSYTSAAISGDQTSIQNYIQIFPNVMLSQDIGGQLLSFSYHRRLGRPTYQDLNPFIDYSSPFEYAIGNQFLRPENIHLFELGYTYGKAINLSLSFSKTNDYLATLISLDKGTLSTRQSIGNFGKYDVFNLRGGYQKSMNKFWKAVSNVNFFYDRYKGMYLLDAIRNRLFGFNFNIRNSFRLHPKITLDVLQLYQSKRVQLTGNSLGRYRADASVNYSFFNGNANLRMAVSDIFYSYLDRGDISFDPLQTIYSNRNENRRFHIGISFAFGRIDFSRQQTKDELDQLKRIKP